MAFNSIAKEYGIWKFHHIFHDIDKPFMKLFLPYSKVQKMHRQNNSHHLEYKNPSNINWEDMWIDWECSHLTKNACPRKATEEAEEKLRIGEMSYSEYCKFMMTAYKIYTNYNNKIKNNENQ